MNRPNSDATPGTSPTDNTSIPQQATTEMRVGMSANVPAGLAPAGNAHPEVLGGYRVERLLGEGGMGAVYLAHDNKLGRAIALKTMRPEIAAQPDAVERFLREARAAAQITHDNVIPILHIGEDAGTPYIAMPLLEGEPLDRFLDRDQRPHVSVVLKVGRETAEGLAAAHALDLVHRDIKPANIWIEGDPTAADPTSRFRRVKILDFGLARPAKDDGRLTGLGLVIGTPAYMSPEQARGLPLDARTDLFSLGVVLYLMTTGVAPFTGDSPMAILTSLAVDHPVPPVSMNPLVPPALSDLVMRLLAKDRDERPKSASEVVAALREIGKQLVAASKAAKGGPLPSVVAIAQPELNPWTEIDTTAPPAPTEVPEIAPPDREPGAARPARPTPRRRPVLWIAGGVVALVVTVVAVVVIKSINSGTKEPDPDTPATTKGNPVVRPKDKGRQTPIPIDADAKASAWVLSVGGKVTIKEGANVKTITADKDLPASPYTVTGISLLGCRNRVADSDLERLSGCVNLASLNLCNTLVGDAGLKHLTGCASLTHLDLYGTRVTEDGLVHLTGLSKLVEVDLNGTNVTATSVGKLQKSLPNCIIAFDLPK